MKIRCIVAVFLLLATRIPASSTFDSLPFASGDFENGPNMTGSSVTANDPFGPGTGSLVTKTSTFTSGSASFGNTYNQKYDGADGTGNFEFDYWSGWSYSRTTDTTTPGAANQYSAIPGSGVSGSSTYAVGFGSSSRGVSYASDFDFSGGKGVFVTNTTYTYLSMLNGDAANGGGPAKKFGGATGDDADFLMLTITGSNGGSQTGSVDFYLADYRFVDNSNDYLVNTWSFVDLSSLGTVDELSFSLSSSDNHPSFGMNTPDYVAIDNLGAIPEPSVAALLLLGVGLGIRLLRRRKV